DDVRVDQAADLRFTDDQSVTQLERLLMMLLALGVGAPAIVDVDTASNESREAAFVEDRRARVDDPPIQSVMSSQAVLEHEAFTFVKQLGVALDAHRSVIG